MTTSTTEQEVTGPPPSFGESGWTPPEGAIWMPITPTAAPTSATVEDDNTPTRSEAPAAPRSHRKHVAAVTAAGGVIGAVALGQAFGVMGLLAAGGAVTGLVAAPVAAYALYKRRGRNRTPMGRRLRGQRLTRRATSRLGSTGLGKGRMPKLGGKSGKLFGGKGAKLGGRSGGPKLGKGSGPKLGGKSGRLLGGKGAKLGTGRSGKLFGGGRGSRLGGKSGAGKGRTTSRLGSIGKGRARGPLSRGSKAGLGLSRRGGKATRGALGRWSKSTGAGAGLLGRKAAASARRRTATAAQRAANTRAGRRVAKAVQAARQAHGQSTAKNPFARWRAATRAAHSQMPRYGRSYSNWATGIGAGVLALLALLDLRIKAWKARRQATHAASSTNATGNASTSTGSTSSGSSSGSSGGSGSRWTSSTTHGGTSSRPNGSTPFTPPPQPPPTIKVEVIRDEPMPPASLGAAPLAIGPGSIRKESSMKFPLLAAAQEFQVAAARYIPPDAHGLAPDFDQLPEVIGYLASGFRSYAIGAEQREPLEQPVIDALHEVHVAFRQAIAAAEQIGPLHRKVHSREIEKAQDPRQRRWNI